MFALLKVEIQQMLQFRNIENGIMVGDRRNAKRSGGSLYLSKR